MSYTIIGGDGKEYGPISEADIRKWISENRLNAHSLAKAESDAAFRPLSIFPEFADVFASHPPGTIAPASPPASDWATRDYDLDIGECISRGWNLFKNNMGTLWGAFIIAFLVIIAVSMVVGLITSFMVPKSLMAIIPFRLTFNIVIQALMALVQGPLFGGLFYVYLQRMRGQAAGAGEVFAGFQKSYSQLFLGNFAITFIANLCFLPFNIVLFEKAMPFIDQMQQMTPGSHPDFSQFWSAIVSTLPIGGACMLPMIYLTVAWQFTLPLIIDKQMDFWDAMIVGLKRVNKHWFHVFGFTVVIGLINIAGLCVCCIGVFFTAALTIAMSMCAYETIFGESKAS